MNLRLPIIRVYQVTEDYRYVNSACLEPVLILTEGFTDLGSDAVCVAVIQIPSDGNDVACLPLAIKVTRTKVSVASFELTSDQLIGHSFYHYRKIRYRQVSVISWFGCSFASVEITRAAPR